MSALRLNQCCSLFVTVFSLLICAREEHFFVFSFYLDHLVWPLVLGPLQPGQPHPPLFPWASAPPHCSQTWRSSSAEREWKEQKGGMWGMWAHSHICQPTEQLALELRLYHGEIIYDRLKQFYINRYQSVIGERVYVADLLLLSERHQCQWLHGLILQNSSKLLILHVLWDLKTATIST